MLLFAKFLVVAALALTPFASLSFAHEYKVGDLTIDHPWTRATPPRAAAGGAYMKITNNGDEADRLIGGDAAFASKVEIHEMSVTDGIMRMRPLSDGLEIPPGATVELKPGGFHIMLMGLDGGLKEGETRSVTFTFERAGKIELLMPVEAIGSTKKHDGNVEMEEMDHSNHSHSN